MQNYMSDTSKTFGGCSAFSFQCFFKRATADIEHLFYFSAISTVRAPLAYKWPSVTALWPAESS